MDFEFVVVDLTPEPMEKEAADPMDIKGDLQEQDLEMETE